MRLKHIGISLLAAMVLFSLTGCQEQIYKQTSSYSSNVSNVKEEKVNFVLKPKIEKVSNPFPLGSVKAKVMNYLYAHKINGSVAILKDNQIIFNEGIGYSNFKRKKLNTSSTTFPIASITKSLLATSVMQLQEKGKININDPVAKYIPGFPNGKNIKLFNLLDHTSGIQEPLWHYGDLTHYSLIREIEKRGVTFPAGSKWDYEDANYMVIGYILEKVTGMPLHTYIQKNIFARANIKDAGFITQKHLNGYTSLGYKLKSNQLYNTSIINAYILFGCGDVYMTAYDLALYDKALMDGKLVNQQSLALIETPGAHSTYGLGLYNIQNGNAHYSHGVLGGWNCLHIFYNDHIIVSVLMNDRDSQTNILRVAEDLHDLVNPQTRA